MTTKTSGHRARLFTQISYFALIILLALWATLIESNSPFPTGLKLALWLAPLLFALPGVLRGQLYTFAWLQFINMIYFCHAVWFWMSDGWEMWLASLEMLLVLGNFSAAIIAIRQAKAEPN
ncbi:MAG: DUF2069 domain-containing protein [Gammaproteobacteria bacterium]|nr:DUF2069 domain-containing protein [Gammaproteobacteria bacterium]